MVAIWPCSAHFEKKLLGNPIRSTVPCVPGVPNVPNVPNVPAFFSPKTQDSFIKYPDLTKKTDHSPLYEKLHIKFKLLSVQPDKASANFS